MSNSDLEIRVAEEFSAYPAGRDSGDGPFNGQRFREELLLPRLKLAIQQRQKLVVDLDQVRSFGSSFLEEAFGGLVRRGVSKSDLKQFLTVKMPSTVGSRYLDAISRYIDAARG